MESPELPNVQQALAAVMGRIPGIGKDERSPEGYSYRGIEAIAKHLQPLLAEHGVIITPLSHLITQTPSIAMKEGWTDTILDVEWRIYGPAGDSIEARTQGIGRDKSDKGAAKALTQARKNLLLSLFSIADKADDADGQTYEHDRTQEEPAASAEAREKAVERIKALTPVEQEAAKVWLRNNRVPALTKAGATLTQLNELEDFIAQLGTEPFGPVEGEAGPSAALAEGVTPARPLPEPESIPFNPVLAKKSRDAINRAAAVSVGDGVE